MIDKETNNTSKEMILKKVCLVAKENVALIAIAIPIVIAIFGYAVDWYYYLYNLGYYKCFGIDGSLMLPYNRTGIYHYLGQLAWGFILGICNFNCKNYFIKKKNYFKRNFVSYSSYNYKCDYSLFLI